MKKNIALLLLSTALCWVMAEVGLRISYSLRSGGQLQDLQEAPTPSPGTEVSLASLLRISFNPDLVYQLRPDLDVLFRGARVRTNSAGWREQELSPHKQAGEVRVVGIGDSIMFGWGVDESLRYMDLLEHALQTAHPELHWRTNVLAAPGYNLVMEIEALQEHGLDPPPDIIIYQYVFNDLCLPIFLTERKDVLSMECFLLAALRRELALPGLVRRHRAMGAGQITATDPAYWATFCDPDAVPPQYRHLVGEESFCRALDRLADIGVQREVPIIVFSGRSPISLAQCPLPQGRDLHFVHAGHEYQQALDNEGCGIEDSSLVLSPKDLHPSPAGHQIIADRLFTYLQQQGITGRIVAANRLAVGQPADYNRPSGKH